MWWSNKQPNIGHLWIFNNSDRENITETFSFGPEDESYMPLNWKYSGLYNQYVH